MIFIEFLLHEVLLYWQTFYLFQSCPGGPDQTRRWMLATLQQGAIKKVLKTPWRFQQTFHTPLKQLPQFVSAILEPLGECESGTVIIDSVVFPPTNIDRLFVQEKIEHDVRSGSSIATENAAELQTLLVAAFGDWLDFAFVPSPKPFVFYADHDEYTTFFANTRSNLNKVAMSLTANRFTGVKDYIRKV